MIAPVYIAAPFGAPTAIGRKWNTERAMLLATIASRAGKAPMVVHPLILDGVYGDDNNPEQRAQGTLKSIALMRAIMMRTHGELWVLSGEGGVLSPGVAEEVKVWRYYRERKNIKLATWAGWELHASRHSLLVPHRRLAEVPKGYERRWNR